MSKKINCSIAGIPFSISCDNNEPIQWLKENYDAFVSKCPSTLRLHLQYKKQTSNSRRLTKVLWENEAFEIRLNGFCINGNIRTGRVNVNTRHRWAIVDLLRSFLSIYLVKKEGFLLHASCILHKGNAYIFCGPSESGKTTIAKLSDRRYVLTDETVAVVRRKGTFYAFATPFHGEFGRINKNLRGRIKALFFIEKSNRFSHEKISSIEAHLELFKNIILHGRNTQIVEDLFDTFYKFTNKVHCFKLSFKEDPLLWRYLDERITPMLP